MNIMSSSSAGTSTQPLSKTNQNTISFTQNTILNHKPKGHLFTHRTTNTPFHRVLDFNNPLLLLNSIFNKLLHLRGLRTSMFLNMRHPRDRARLPKLILSILGYLIK